MLVFYNIFKNLLIVFSANFFKKVNNDSFQFIYKFFLFYYIWKNSEKRFHDVISWIINFYFWNFLKLFGTLRNSLNSQNCGTSKRVPETLWNSLQELILDQLCNFYFNVLEIKTHSKHKSRHLFLIKIQFRFKRNVPNRATSRILYFAKFWFFWFFSFLIIGICIIYDI